MVPDFLPGLSVEAGDDFLQIRAIPEIAVDVQPAIGDHGRGLPWKISSPKGFPGVDLVWQALLLRYADVRGSAPVEPSPHRGSRHFRGEKLAGDEQPSHA